MDTRDKSTMANVVGWLALIISIVALVLAWTAFNRAGEDLEDRVQEEVQQVMPETDRQETQPETQPQFETQPQTENDEQQTQPNNNNLNL